MLLLIAGLLIFLGAHSVRIVADGWRMRDGWVDIPTGPGLGVTVDEEFVRVGVRLACWERIRGGTPTFVAPEYEEELGMAHGVTPESLATLRDTGDWARAEAPCVAIRSL